MLRCKSLCLVLFFAALSFAEVAAPDSGKAAVSGCAEGTVIAQVDFKGLEHTKPRVVERELLNRVGEAFSKEKFEIEKARLQDLDLFTEITVSCDKVGELAEPTSIKLTYHFKEIFRWIPAPAGKKTDRDGLMLGLALANINVLGEDIRLEVQYRTTVDPFFDKNEVAFYASSPYLFGTPLGWNFEFLMTDSYDEIRDFPERSLLWDFDVDYEVKEHFSLLGTAALRMISTWGGAILPEIGAGIALDYRDSKLDTRKGTYFEYMLTHVGAGSNFMVSNSECGEGLECSSLKGENYWELLTDARAYKTFGRFITGATALVRYRPGDVEFYDYYYHGGANTFRGHEADSGSLGVHEALLTLEERFVLMERHAASIWGINFFYGVQLVAGFDGSLLWDKGRPGWDNYEGAVYGGIHLVIPALDRIRFEVGYSPDKGEPVFYFGLFDKVTSSRWRSR
ncbi:MAG: outer membrane protein assembly factor [Fibrobacter sp.]|uniref:POTRA domain-containing protein n=1 Tax=Fibrobacter sp. TaxID=35828 RepID=UPI0025C5F189|nr:POTRA domain-containing protein [Fibrobacter sp.]MBR4784171.1 outer membrane protein assembly factor [Fibrobacter sp.]